MAKIVSTIHDLQTTNHELFCKAKKLIPGGVNSPVRSFKGVGGTPIFIKKGAGSKIYSEENKKYIDYCLSWGALILGHAHPLVVESVKKAVEKGTSFGTCTKLEIELAELIVEAVSSIEKVRLVSSGTEAVMSAIRLARAYAKRDGIIKFYGAYHGHSDYLLTKAGSGLLNLDIPASKGVPNSFTKHTITLPYNDVGKIEETVKKYKNKIAAIIVEPVMANTGVILPNKGFLQFLRKITQRHNIVLIFDEVITGFRLSFGGAQEYFKVKPDLTCLGKIIGGGLPVGAFGGRREIMDLLAPKGSVYQAGTLSGNPISVTAGITALKILRKTKPYKNLKDLRERLSKGIIKEAGKYGIELKMSSIASMFSLSFKNTALFKKFFHGLLNKGIYFSPSAFETNFLSIAHTEEDIDKTLEAVKKAVQNL